MKWSTERIMWAVVAAVGLVGLVMGYFVTENIKEALIGSLILNIGLIFWVNAGVKEVKKCCKE
ncbi:MAG: hypothetical protein C4562_04790 [Actinobacteria bacterium]|nr:MAG: hypothetical protein C4562_04790 [Actinomycetota bacterium]